MSHFTVMVIGANIEEQLAPYDENIRVDKYYQGEVPEKDKQDMLKYYQEKEKLTFKDFDDCYGQKGKEWNGGCWEKDEDGVWKEYSTYNPKSKWDWWCIGGRWSGSLITHLKPEAKDVISEENFGESGLFNNEVGIDSIEKKYIDFDAIRKEKEDNARERYRKIASLFENNEIPRIEYTFNGLREKYPDMSAEERREMYGSQPGVQVWEDALNKDKNKKEERIIDFYPNIEDYQCTEDEFAKSAGDNSFVTYALVKDGEWYQRGRMGWFGISSDEMEGDKWSEFVRKTLEETDDDELITIVDCHI